MLTYQDTDQHSCMSWYISRTTRGGHCFTRLHTCCLKNGGATGSLEPIAKRWSFAIRTERYLQIILISWSRFLEIVFILKCTTISGRHLKGWPILPVKIGRASCREREKRSD